MAIYTNYYLEGFPGGSPRWLGGKESACKAGDSSLIPGLGRCPWRRKWQPTPVFLPGKSHEQKSLAGFSPQGHKRIGYDLATNQQHFFKKRMSKQTCWHVLNQHTMTVTKFLVILHFAHSVPSLHLLSFWSSHALWSPPSIVFFPTFLVLILSASSLSCVLWPD